MSIGTNSGRTKTVSKAPRARTPTVIAADNVPTAPRPAAVKSTIPSNASHSKPG